MDDALILASSRESGRIEFSGTTPGIGPDEPCGADSVDLPDVGTAVALLGYQSSSLSSPDTDVFYRSMRRM
jgi:hypothetical protein